MPEALSIIVQRVFHSKPRSTLLTESTALQASELADTCLGLRAQMLHCLEGLPALAFEPAPDRLPGETGWTAGEIVSHNTDRLLWALTEATATAGLSESIVPRPPEVVASNAAHEPILLDRCLALEVVQAANGHLKSVLPLLLSTDRGETTTRTHHGPMSVKSWLLLICIHDSDHLGQLRARQEPGTLA